ncbi:MAG: hypothetical protein AAF849_16325 [Bacteroidota bacterium]
MANTSGIFSKYNLYDKEWQRWRMGVSLRQVKQKLIEVDDPIVEEKLKRSIFLINLSRVAFAAFVIAFIIAIIT